MSRWLHSIGATAALGAAVAMAAATASGQQLPSPPAQSKYVGSDLFKTYCAVCHGKSARGDGPLAASLKRPPPDLTQFAARNGGVFPSAMVAQIIDGRRPVNGHGGADMPVWGDAFAASRTGSSEEDVQARIKALVEHLEWIQERRGP